MNLSDKAIIPPQVMARTVGSETVILQLESGSYFGLDPVGALIWQLLGEGKTLAAVCDGVQEHHDVPRDVVERDVTSLAETLLEQNLIRVA